MTHYPLKLSSPDLIAERPVTLPHEVTLSEDGEVRAASRLTGQGELALLPPEFYLRGLMRLELDSDEALLNFMGEFGLLGESPAGSLSATQGIGLEAPTTTLRAARERAAVLRDTTRTLLANEGVMDEEVLFSAWESRGGKPLEMLTFTMDDEPLKVAVVLAATTITRGLAPYGVSVETADSTVQRGVSLESAVCLQMFNHLAESATYRACQLDTCSTVFVRQVGRSQYGQHRRVGVQYCSPACARLAATRRSRDKKRAERSATKGEEQ